MEFFLTGIDDFGRNVEAFGFDNSSSSLTDNHKNNFVVLGEGPTDDVDGSTCEKV